MLMPAHAGQISLKSNPENTKLKKFLPRLKDASLPTPWLNAIEILHGSMGEAE
jgi:hypothetical protein